MIKKKDTDNKSIQITVKLKQGGEMPLQVGASTVKELPLNVKEN